jgi:hypothetical protein
VLNYVTLTGTIPGAAGAVVTATLSGWEPDATDGLLIPPKPDPVICSPSGVFALSGLVANDNADIAAGSYWTITVTGLAGVALYEQVVELLYANGATQDISGLAAYVPPAQVAGVMPLPTGTPVAGQVPEATGHGQASAWATPASAPVASVNGKTGVVVLAASDVGADVSGAAATAQGNAETFATSAAAAAESASDPAGSASAALSAAEAYAAGQASAAVTSAETFATSAVATETTRAETAEGTNATAISTETTRAEAAEALALLKAGGTMSGPIAMGTSKITGLGNGSGAQDAAAFGQTPAGGATATIAQGGTGQTTDPLPPWMASDSGYLAWNFDAGAIGGSTAVTNNTITLVRINIRKAMSVTNVLLAINGGGTGLVTNENFAGLYSSAGTLIGATADQTSNWAGGGLKTLALTGGPFNLSAGTFVWVAILANESAGGTPTFWRGQNNSGSVQNAGTTVSTARWATNTTGTTLPASITPSASSLISATFWAALS